MSKATRTVLAKCPVCSALVPMFTVTAQVRGFVRPSVALEVDADGSDYVAHMWSHSQGEPSWA